MTESTHEEQLETIFLEFFQCFASLRAYRMQLAKHLGAGFFAFSEARHAQEHIMLDSSSYAGRAMSPLVQVDFANNHVFHLTNTQSNQPSSQSSESAPMVRKRVFNRSSAQNDRERKLDKLIAKAAERSRRNLDPNASNRTDQSDSDSDAENSSDEDSADAPVLDLSRNPLLWFGVLAPPQVKQSQKEFSAALTDAIEIATLNAKLTQLADQYEKLSNSTDDSSVGDISQDMSKVSLQTT